MGDIAGREPLEVFSRTEWAIVNEHVLDATSDGPRPVHPAIRRMFSGADYGTDPEKWERDRYLAAQYVLALALREHIRSGLVTSGSVVVSGRDLVTVPPGVLFPDE